MKPITTYLAFLLLSVFTLCSQAADPAKPPLKLSPDGFPSGHETPEGVACDLARAFIQCDEALFAATCIRLYGGGEARAAYADFLQKAGAGMKAEAGRTEGPRRGPKAIEKVFAARPLSKQGPASYGYASFGFQDIRFVDVRVQLHNGEQAANRTMVIKDKDGQWYVHPLPTASPLLSMGLNDETDSEKDFTEAYEVEK